LTKLSNSPWREACISSARRGLRRNRYLPGITGLKVPEEFLSGAELVGFQGSPRTLAIERDPCVKNSTGLPDVKSGSRGGFPTGGF
jgi:hypothetical protein